MAGLLLECAAAPEAELALPELLVLLDPELPQAASIRPAAASAAGAHHLFCMKFLPSPRRGWLYTLTT